MRKFIFVLLLSVGIISAIGGVWMGRSMRWAAGSFYESDFVQYTAETLVGAFDNGGLTALEDIEQRINPERKLRFFVFDSGVRELSGRVGAAQVRAFAAGLRPEAHAQFDALSGRLLAGIVVEGRDGRLYRIVIRFPKRALAGVPINLWAWIGRIAAIIAVASLLCFWVAWRLSAPLSHLQQAARRFASGDFKARADASTFSHNPPEYKELARDFDEMASRLEILVDSQRQLLRDVSHELRTPLTRLNLAINNARHAQAAAIACSLDRIDQESERLNALIDRILRLSRFEALAQPPGQDNIELADFIESIVSDADFEATANRRRVSIERVETCRIAGDRELLREAIENILRNSIRYTPEGTVVTVDARCAGPSEYQIGIRDCGPGVDREHLEAIFEPFYRAPEQPDSSGFGIGLAIAKRAISLHQGTITAHNVADGGFEVAIHLPVAATPA